MFKPSPERLAARKSVLARILVLHRQAQLLEIPGAAAYSLQKLEDILQSRMLESLLIVESRLRLMIEKCKGAKLESLVA